MLNISTICLIKSTEGDTFLVENYVEDRKKKSTFAKASQPVELQIKLYCGECQFLSHKVDERSTTRPQVANRLRKQEIQERLH